jgi:hypothetical protein
MGVAVRDNAPYAPWQGSTPGGLNPSENTGGGVVEELARGMNQVPGADASLKGTAMNLPRLSTATLGTLLLGSSLFGQAPTPGSQTLTPVREARVEQRADKQQKRIASGVASGILTPRETARLERQEAKINRDIARAESDGRITKKEAARIQKEQNQESRRIFRQKHDAQTSK